MDQERLRRTLLLEMHRSIDDSVRAGLDVLEGRGSGVGYPPGTELTQEEIGELTRIPSSAIMRSALGKILRDVAAGPLFDLFALMDGVSDPEAEQPGDGDESWLGVTVTGGRDDDSAMWHDEFFETYWDYREAVGDDA